MDDTDRAARRHAVRSKVQSGLSIAASGMKIAQISDLPARARSQYAEAKNSTQSAPWTQLIAALEAVTKSKWLETLGKDVGVISAIRY